MQKTGAYLKNVREEKGFSIEEVSKATKISTPVLRALEEGRLDNADPVYLKGFLKLYCRFLGIIWEDFLKEHPLPFPVKEPPRAVVSKPGSIPFFSQAKWFNFAHHKKVIAIVLSVIALFLFLAALWRGYVLVKKQLTRPRLEDTQINKTLPSASKKHSPVAKPKQAQKTKTETLSKNIQTLPLSASSPLSNDVKSKVITLVTRAAEDNFIKVKVDGQTVYQGLLHKGKAESWSAKEKIELSVANAGAMVLEIDGKTLPPLGRRGEPLKNILINHEGLRIL